MAEAQSKKRFRWDTKDNVKLLRIVQQGGTFGKAAVFGQATLAWESAAAMFLSNVVDTARAASISWESLKKHTNDLLNEFAKSDNKAIKSTGTEEELTELVCYI